MAAARPIKSIGWLSSSLPQIVKRVIERQGPSLHLVNKKPLIRLQRLECTPEAWSTLSTSMSGTPDDILVMARPISPSAVHSDRNSSSKGASSSNRRYEGQPVSAVAPSCSLMQSEGPIDSLPPCIRRLAEADAQGQGIGSSSTDGGKFSLPADDSSLTFIEEQGGVRYYGLVIQSYQDPRFESGCYLLKTCSTEGCPGTGACLQYSLTKLCQGQELATQMRDSWLI